MGIVSPADLDAQLRQGLGFSEDDLAANRQGMITTNNQERLKAHFAQTRQSGRAGLYPVFFNAAFMVVMVFVFGYAGFIVLPTADASSLSILAVILLAVEGFFGWQAYSAWTYHQRIQSGNFPVKKISGVVNLVVVNYVGISGIAMRAAGGEGKAYQIKIGGIGAIPGVAGIGAKIMYADKATFAAFRSGQRYDIYYAPLKIQPLILSAAAVV